MGVLKDCCDILPQKGSSREVREAALMLLDACRAMLKVDRYDPMGNPPRSDEIKAIRKLRQSIRDASRIEHFFVEEEQTDPLCAVLERSGLSLEHCHACGESILVRAHDERLCAKCDERVQS